MLHSVCSESYRFVRLLRCEVQVSSIGYLLCVVCLTPLLLGALCCLNRKRNLDTRLVVIVNAELSVVHVLVSAFKQRYPLGVLAWSSL